MLRLVAATFAFSVFCPVQGTAQTYNEIEANVRRQIEADRARTLGDCSEAMLSWLGMRFTEAEQRQGRARQACEAAQLFALRNRVPFLEALPKVAIAMGGTRREPCPSHATDSPTYLLYSACRVPAKPWVAPPPSQWDLDREAEVRELGADMLRHLGKCVPRTTVSFAFSVDSDGKIGSFSDGGDWGRVGPPPAEARELKRIEKTLESDARCSVFPENLRHRYVSIKFENGRSRVAQVRDEADRR